jgi:hypothetical protein
VPTPQPRLLRRFSSQRSDHLCVPTSLIFNEQHVHVSLAGGGEGVKVPGLQFDYCVHTVPTLRMSGSIRPFALTSSWHCA